jgi:putative hydrolase of the HAD superfamily
MIKAVFFDLYQTLVHYQPTQEELQAQALNGMGFKTTAAALARTILTANEFIYIEMAKRPLSKRSQKEIAELYMEYQRIVLKGAGINTDEKTVLKLLAVMQKTQLDIVLFDDTMLTLTELKKRGLTTGLISNIEKNMSETIEKLGIASKLDVVVTSLEAGAPKPQPEIFRYAMQKGNVRPDESIFVGDQYQVDMVGAKSAGMKAILLDRTGYYAKKLDTPKIKNLREIVNFLN